MMRPPTPSVLLPSVTRRRALALGALGAAMTVSARHAAAQVHIDVTGGNFQPMPIAIPDFIPVTAGDADTAHGITQIITANLQRSGLFVPIDPAAFIEKITSLDAQPNFQSWRSINAQALIVGRFSRQPDGRFKAEFRLWDVLGGQQTRKRPAVCDDAGKLAPPRRTSFPTRSTSASPAKRVISTAASCSSTRPVPRSAVSNVSP